MTFSRSKIAFVFLFFVCLLSLNFFLFNLGAVEFLSLLSYVLLSWLLGVTFWPICLRALPDMKSSSYSIAKVLGVGFFFFFMWLFHHVSFLNGPWTSSIMLLVVIFSFFRHSQEEFSREAIKNYRNILNIEILFVVTFFAILSLYAMHPELYWGEKPMDFSLLGFMSRYPDLPPEDPWFAGSRMHYYYWGYFYVANLAKMAGLSSELAYGCGLALSGALLAVSFYGVLSLAVKKYSHRLVGSLILLFSGNIASLIYFFFKQGPLDMTYFWSSSRVFSKGAFAEYPSWSFLFADLHAHVLSYPFAICFLTLLLYGLRYVWSKFELDKHGAFLGVYALSYGLLLLVNGWDFLIYSLLACLLWILQGLSGRRYLKNWLSFLTGHLLGVLLASPILFSLLGGAKKELLISTVPMNGPRSLLLFFGGWLFIISLCGLHLKLTKRKVDKSMVNLLLGSLLVILVAENIIFMDRINTLFKTYTNIYSWLGIVALYSVSALGAIDKRGFTKLTFGISSVIIISQLIGFLLNTFAVVGSRPFAQLGYGLKGGSYLERSSPSDFKVVNWLRKNVKGLPMILEKDSSSFDQLGARISMHTGLATYLGWHNHVRLRGATNSEINKRRAQIAYFYGSPDALKVNEQLQNSGVQFVVLGDFERNSFDSTGIQKFKAYGDLFTPLVSMGKETYLFGVGNFASFLKTSLEDIKKTENQIKDKRE